MPPPSIRGQHGAQGSGCIDLVSEARLADFGLRINHENTVHGLNKLVNRLCLILVKREAVE
jgi:hypothetical protein